MAKQPHGAVRSLRPTILAALLGCYLCRTFVTPRSFGAGDRRGLSATGSDRRAPARAERLMRAAEADQAAEGVRIGLVHCPGVDKEWKGAFMALNVTNETYFQTEVPDSFQSNTVDVIVAVHDCESETVLPEILRGFQTVALTTNVPIVPVGPQEAGIDAIADRAVQMAEIRQQALMGGGPRRSIFFGIGSNQTAGDPKKKGKIYF
eukprot:Skav219688  [mRNA]  locus=scaffold817:127305:133333:- [translate_table: standard]